MRSVTTRILAVVSLVGCGGGVRQVKRTIAPFKDMNDARSCHLLARAVDEKV